MDTFEAEMVESARLYHLQVAQGKAKGYVAPEAPYKKKAGRVLSMAHLGKL